MNDSRSRVPGPGCRSRVLISGFQLPGFGLWVSGIGFRFLGSGFRVPGKGIVSRIRVESLVCKVYDEDLRVTGCGFRVPCLGSRVPSFEIL